MNKLILSLLVFTAGCAGTGTNGVIPTGSNQYMVGGLGGFTDFSGSVVKANFIKEAMEFCKAKELDTEIISSTSKDSEYGQYASAEVQFKCVPIK